jgi:hypothetical protein
MYACTWARPTWTGPWGIYRLENQVFHSFTNPLIFCVPLQWLSMFSIWKTWHKQLLIGPTAVCYRYTRNITICGAKKFLLRVSRETWEPLAALSSSTFKMPFRWSQIWWSWSENWDETHAHISRPLSSRKTEMGATQLPFRSRVYAQGKSNWPSRSSHFNEGKRNTQRILVVACTPQDEKQTEGIVTTYLKYMNFKILRNVSIFLFC